MTLLAFPETVLKRAQGDPSPDRVVSKRADVQALPYAEVTTVLPFLRERSLVLSAEDGSPDQLAQTICEAMLRNGSDWSEAVQLGAAADESSPVRARRRITSSEASPRG